MFFVPSCILENTSKTNAIEVRVPLLSPFKLIVDLSSGLFCIISPPSESYSAFGISFGFFRSPCFPIYIVLTRLRSSYQVDSSHSVSLIIMWGALPDGEVGSINAENRGGH